MYTPAAEFQYIVPSQSVVDPVAVSDVRPQHVVSEHYGVILYAVARAEYNVFIMAPKLARQTHISLRRQAGRLSLDCWLVRGSTLLLSTNFSLDNPANIHSD